MVAIASGLPSCAGSETLSPAVPGGYSCAQGDLTVFAVDRGLAGHVCDLAADVDPMLSSCGLPAGGPLTLYVVERINAEVEHCLGVYVCETEEIAVVSPATLADDDTLPRRYRTMAPETLFDSLVVHELTHARLSAALGERRISRVSHEYIAQAMQIAALPELARKDFLAGVPAGNIDVSMLNEVTMLMGPDVFAGLVWRHFEGPENGCDFIRSLMEGEVSLGLSETG